MRASIWLDWIAVFALVALLLIGCGEDEETTAPVDPLEGAALCLSDDTCTFDASCDTSGYFEVTNCGNSSTLTWSGASDAGWLRLSVATAPTPSGFHLLADSNDTGTERAATVTVTADGLTGESETIAVTQPSLQPALFVSIGEWEAPTLGGTSPIVAVTNIGNATTFDWTVAENVAWLEVSANSGSTPSGFTITVDPNATDAERSGVVTVEADGIEGSPWDITVHQPRIVSLAATFEMASGGYGLWVSGGYAYVGGGSAGLHIINIADPDNPSLTETCGTPGNAGADLFFGGEGALFVADAYAGVHLVNVSDAVNPSVEATFDTPDCASGVFVTDGYTVCVADGQSGLQIVDFSSGSNPTFLGGIDTDGFSTRVFVSGDYAFVADSMGGLLIFDVSDPYYPEQAAVFPTSDYARDVFVAGNFAYVSVGLDGLQIIDVSVMTSTALAGETHDAANAAGIYVVGDFAYIAAGADGLKIVDVSNPSSPTLTATCVKPGASFRDVFVYQDHAYVTSNGGLEILQLGWDVTE